MRKRWRGGGRFDLQLAPLELAEEQRVTDLLGKQRQPFLQDAQALAVDIALLAETEHSADGLAAAADGQHRDRGDAPVLEARPQPRVIGEGGGGGAHGLIGAVGADQRIVLGQADAQPLIGRLHALEARRQPHLMANQLLTVGIGQADHVAVEHAQPLDLLAEDAEQAGQLDGAADTQAELGLLGVQAAPAIEVSSNLRQPRLGHGRAQQLAAELHLGAQRGHFVAQPLQFRGVFG